LYYI
jgi:hypothetical protein